MGELEKGRAELLIKHGLRRVILGTVLTVGADIDLKCDAKVRTEPAG